MHRQDDYLPESDRKKWIESRMDSVLNAIFDCWRKERECPQDWIVELLDLRKQLDRIATNPPKF